MTAAKLGRSCLSLSVFAVLVFTPGIAHAQEDYRTFFGFDPRLTVWFVAELHLLFAAFVLGVPIFAVIVELISISIKDPDESQRYDDLAYEFVRLLSAAFATTAALGGLLSFVLFSCYPKFMEHLTHTFHPTFFVYALLFLVEGFTLYIYYYGWHRLTGRSNHQVLRRVGLVFVLVPLLVIAGAVTGLLPFMNLKLVAAASIVAIVSLGLFCGSFGKKGFHIYLGVLLNIVGTTLMLISNSWATYMMSPPGLAEGAAGTLETHWDGTTYIGPLSDAFFNYLWNPLNIHRMLANVAFGGAICAAFAAIKFLSARNDEDRAHYDWMGYVGSFIAISALIPLPFAGYYLGREIYSFNPTMGQDMMGGTFSWTFILQAVFVGTLFIGGNYYIWSGMKRIPGGERYQKHVIWMVAVLFFCFGVWLTPHNLPLGGLEKRFGLMPAKNAVIQLMILTTFFGYLLYRRANKRDVVTIKSSGKLAYIAIGIATAVAMVPLYLYSSSSELSDPKPFAVAGATQSNPVVIASMTHGLSDGDRVLIDSVGGMTEINGREFTIANVTTGGFELSGEDGTKHTAYTGGGSWIDPDAGDFVVEELPLGPINISLGGAATFAATLRATLYLHMLALLGAMVLAFLERGKLAQGILLGVTAFLASAWLFQHGFTIMEKANPLVRQVAVCQVLMILGCMILTITIDIFLFRNAESLGSIRWGQMHARSQLVLILLCTFFVMNMGLMGFIRSGLRKGWHVVAVLKDTSEWSGTPSNLTMAIMVSIITIVFLGMTTLVFWTASLSGPPNNNAATKNHG